MNKRTRKKIYNRAVRKLESGEQLSAREKQVFALETMRLIRRVAKFFTSISHKLISEGFVTAAQKLKQQLEQIRQPGGE